MSIRTATSHIRMPRFDSWLCFQTQLLLKCSLGDSTCVPVTHVGVLASAWPKPRCCRHLESKPKHRSSLSLSLSNKWNKILRQLYIERKRQRKTKIIYSLVHSQDGCYSQSWATSKPGASASSAAFSGTLEEVGK